MYVLVTYDVATADAAGRKRLAGVAKTCVRYGQRVQNSVFECQVTPSEYVELREALRRICDESCDTVRLYNLGKNWAQRVEHIGAKVPYNAEDPFVF